MSQQKIHKILNSMKKNMDCPICLELMCNPVSTKCNHHFCKFCIIEFIHKKRQVPCPICKVALTKRSFQENSKLGKIIEKLKNLLTVMAKATVMKEDNSVPNRSLLVINRGIKRKVYSNNKSEVLDATKVENSKLNGENLAKEKGQELFKNLKTYSRANDVHKNRKRIIQWLQQLPSFFDDWNEDKNEESSRCELFQPVKTNIKMSQYYYEQFQRDKCDVKKRSTLSISNSSLKDDISVYDISISQTCPIYSEAINRADNNPKEYLKEKPSNFNSTTPSNSTYNGIKRQKRTLKPKKQLSYYKKLRQLMWKKIEQSRKLRYDKKNKSPYSSVNTVSKNDIIDLTSLMPSPSQQEYSTEMVNRNREIVGTKKYHDKKLSMNESLAKAKIKNQEKKPRFWKDTKLSNILNVQQASKRFLYKFREMHPESVKVHQSDLNNSDRQDSSSGLSPLNRSARTKNCSAVKTTPQLKEESSISFDVELIVSHKVDKTNDKTSPHKDAKEFSKPLHNSEMLEVTERSHTVTDTVVPCNSSNLSTINQQMSTKESCDNIKGNYNVSNENIISASKENIFPLHAAEMRNKTGESLKISKDGKPLSNFLLIPDFKLVDYSLTQNSVTSEDNIKLDCMIYPQTKESVLSQDREINNEKELNTEKCSPNASISLSLKDSLCNLENCKENAEDVNENQCLKGSPQDKNTRTSNCELGDNLNNSSFLFVESYPLFNSNSKVDNKEICDKVDCSLPNNTGDLADSDSASDKTLTPTTINSFHDTKIVPDFSSQLKYTTPKTSFTKMSDLNSQESSKLSCKTNLTECHSSSCIKIPCSVDFESNSLNILPELQKLYQNETSESEKKETPKEKVVLKDELFSQSLPVNFKCKESRTTTIPKSLNSQSFTQAKRSKRKCFSLDGRYLKSVFSDKVLNCESEINESSTKYLPLIENCETTKSEFNYISMDRMSWPVEEKKKNSLEKRITPEVFSDHILSLQLDKRPKKRKRSKTSQCLLEIKNDNLKDPSLNSDQDETACEKYIDLSNAVDTSSDSPTQAPSCVVETLESLTDKALSPTPSSLASNNLMTERSSEPLLSSWSQHNLPPYGDDHNSLTESKETELFQDSDIVNKDVLFQPAKGVTTDQKNLTGIQSFSSNVKDCHRSANISQGCLDIKAKLSVNPVCEVSSDFSTQNMSGLSQTTSNDVTFVMEDNKNTLVEESPPYRNSFNETEITPEKNVYGIGKDRYSSNVRTVPQDAIIVASSSQLHVTSHDVVSCDVASHDAVTHIAPHTVSHVTVHEVNISTQKNESQFDGGSGNTVQVTGHRLSNEFETGIDEPQKDLTSNVGEKSTLSSKEDCANIVSINPKVCVSESHPNDHPNISKNDREKCKAVISGTALPSSNSLKKSKCLVISDSEAEQSDDGEPPHTNNGTTHCSENVASQTQKYTTQLCVNLENDLVEMKRQIALLEAKLGMEDSINEHGNELEVTPCQDTEAAVADSGLIKTLECDDKYRRLSSDEEEVIPDSFQEEPSPEAENCLLFDDNTKSATEDSEDLFFSPSFQRSSTPTGCPNILSEMKHSQHHNKKHLQSKRRCKNVPIIESDESDDAICLPHENEDLTSPNITSKYISNEKHNKHLRKEISPSTKCDPYHISSNLSKTSVNVDFDGRSSDKQSADRRKPIKHLVATGLSNVDVQKVKQFCDKAGYKFSPQFSSSVTHVIVKPVSPQVRYCDRTLKYFQGIAHKCWVLSLQWILQQSLNNQTTLKEADFEITGDTVNGKHHRGPTKSRLSNRYLFTSYQIHFTGETSELPLEVLRNMVKTLDGKVVTKPEHFNLNSKNTCLIISSGNQGSHKSAQRLPKKKGVLLLSREWLLDSIAMYEIQTLESYILL